ncbi:hypothetical protein GGS23DRAFT_5897 [Durotheca rogersii]|uniref:uncharacterized protein n=1 Tax=Durotheca rogersii TaxID=419775 RepID=UPI00221EFB96|nr:uncharacterized protein GGS23DRAFT_5897 [Durotheca rogersii]KAI5867984.1 hypothetical protein GGS23DRAFT_5897 [Durotheca rogersii]
MPLSLSLLRAVLLLRGDGCALTVGRRQAGGRCADLAAGGRLGKCGAPRCHHGHVAEGAAQPQAEQAGTGGIWWIGDTYVHVARSRAGWLLV